MNNMSCLYRSCWLFAIALLCGCAPGPSPQELNVAYEQALQRTAAAAVAFEPGSAAETQVLQRLEAYFANMTVDSVSRLTGDVYAPDGWLYDNLGVIEGAAAIEAYFLQSLDNADAIAIEFLQVTRDQADYFVRWRMTINAGGLNDGVPLISYGISQFRFAQDGRVLVHRDFWDAGTGIYEYLPVLGGVVRRARSLLAGEHE